MKVVWRKSGKAYRAYESGTWLISKPSPHAIGWLLTNSVGDFKPTAFGTVADAKAHVQKDLDRQLAGRAS
jgi:hypothetical protein